MDKPWQSESRGLPLDTTAALFAGSDFVRRWLDIVAARLGSQTIVQIVRGSNREPGATGLTRTVSAPSPPHSAGTWGCNGVVADVPGEYLGPKAASGTKWVRGVVHDLAAPATNAVDDVDEVLLQIA